MNYDSNSLVLNIPTPPIDETQSWILNRKFPTEKPLLDVAQAVPAYPPAESLRDHLAELIRKGELSGYTDVLGMPDLRQAYASHIMQEYGGRVSSDQVAITAGCNQAFCLAINAIAGQGDEVILSVPYYFNHQMWLEMQGIKPVLLHPGSAESFNPDSTTAEALITDRTKAIVLITPNNPTGAIYPADTIKGFYALAQRRNIALIIDETYKDFIVTAEPPHTLFQQPEWPENLVHLYSFSKAYSLAGYRVGAIAGKAELIAEIAKISDCIAISAPTVGQVAALYGLANLGKWVAEKRKLMNKRRMALESVFSESKLGYRLLSVGAYFAYVQHPFLDQKALQVAKRLCDQQHILSLPGNIFGPGQERFLRVAFANLNEAQILELGRRLLEDTRH